jgi:formate hydrogenlyase subunit 4
MGVPLYCQIFLILFGGFFATQLTFNSQKFAESNRMDSPQAGFAFKPAGFLMFGFVLMLIATLPMLQIGGFSSAKELVAGIGIFTLFAFIFNLGLVLKVWSTFDGADHQPKNAIRPLIPLIAVIIYFITS